MSELRRTSDVLGSLFHVARLKELSGDNCNVLMVSDRTLYILERFARNEVNWLSRYAEDFIGAGKYVPVDLLSPDIDFVQTVARLFRLEVTDMSCDLVEAINNLASQGASGGGGCGCDVGDDVDTDDGIEGGSLPGPVAGVPYLEPSPIEDRKCLAANYIHMSVRDVVEELRIKRVDQYSYAGIVVVLGIVATVIGGVIAGPFGVLVGAVIGGLLGMAGPLFKASFSFTLLEDAITADEDAAVCALFDATTAAGARAAYLTYLGDNGATSLELDFIEFFLPNNLMNVLFFSWLDSESAIQAIAPVSDCSTCSTSEVSWTFSTGDDGFTHEDNSSNGGSSSMAYDGGDEALAITQHTDPVVDSLASGDTISPSFSLTVGASTHQWVTDFTGPTDGIITGVRTIIYFDSYPGGPTEVDVSTGLTGTGSKQRSGTVNTAGEIVRIVQRIERSNGAGAQEWDYDVDIDQIGIFPI